MRFLLVNGEMTIMFLNMNNYLNILYNGKYKTRFRTRSKVKHSNK